MDEKMISELVDGLYRIFKNGIQQIILYGSAARKEDTPESDIDIAIILKETMTAENKDKVLSLAVELDTRYERVFSIIDIEQEKMEKWGKILPFYKNIQNEGVVLWRAA